MVDTANVTSGIPPGVYDVVWRVAREFKWVFIAAVGFIVLVNFDKVFPFLSRWMECLNFRTARFNTNHALGRPPGSPVLSYEHIPCRTGMAANYLRQLFELPMYMFQYIALGHRQLGPVFRDNLGGSTELVFVADAACVHDIHRASGPYPGHLVPDAWTLYLKMTSKKRGLFFMDGPEWAEMRHILNQGLVRPGSVRPHFPALDSSTVGLMEALWEAQRAGTLKNRLVTELYRWSLECAYMDG